MPAIATHDESIPLTHSRVYHRKEGEALHPERQSLAYLRTRQANHPYILASQFQQDPIAREGAFVKPEWFPYYDDPPRTGVVVQSWDTASGTGVRNSFSVGITAIYNRKKWYILDVFRSRVSYHDLKANVWSLCRKHQVTRLLIENASSGQSLIDDTRRHDDARVPRPIAITPVGDKQSRFEAIASRIQTGDVVLPRSAPWLHEFLSEITKFPGGRFRDQADALAQLIANPPPALDDGWDDDSGPELHEPGDSYRNEYCEDPDDDGWNGN